MNSFVKLWIFFIFRYFVDRRMHFRICVNFVNLGITCWFQCSSIRIQQSKLRNCNIMHRYVGIVLCSAHFVMVTLKGQSCSTQRQYYCQINCCILLTCDIYIQALTWLDNLHVVVHISAAMFLSEGTRVLNLYPQGNRIKAYSLISFVDLKSALKIISGGSPAQFCFRPFCLYLTSQFLWNTFNALYIYLYFMIIYYRKALTFVLATHSWLHWTVYFWQL
jgi:hypothetical protein